jgi:FAD/FMN-containing dehydrogenase
MGDTVTGKDATYAGADVETLRTSLRGIVITPADSSYDEARSVWNGMIDRRPALIVKCNGTADVIACVNYARDQNLPVAVRGGGHNVGGSAVCDGGLVIDLSPMRNVRVDPERRVARVGGGATLGDIDHETQAFGLATPAGVVSETGIGGLSLHGGMGFLMRRHGLASDNILSADVVTADGKLIVADQNNNADLLWALRGGGGNFGVVTSFEFQLHSVGPTVWIAMVMYPVAAAQQVLQYFRDFPNTAPDELSGITVLWTAPTEDPIPEEHRGKPIIAVLYCYTGDFDKGEEVLRPLRSLATPVVDLSGPMPFVEAQRIFDPDYPRGRRYYWKSTYLRDLSDEVINLLTTYETTRPSPINSIDLWMLGGAMGRVAPESTAFYRRDAPFLVGIEANWDDPAMDEANIAWVRDFYRDAQQFSPGGVYLNFAGFAEEGEALMQASYGGNYERLREIKAKFDPENFFRSNLNISVKR